MLGAPLLMLWAYLRRDKMLLSVSLFIAAIACLAYFAGYVLPVVDEESLLRVSGKIKKFIKPGDVVGVASNEISYHRLNIPLKDYMVIRADKHVIDSSQTKGKSLASRKDFINEFLTTKDRRIFCVITKDDYYKFVEEKLRDKLYLIDKTFIWKRFHKQDKEYFRHLLSYFLEGKKESLKRSLKEEIYLISNRMN
jgi:uncharacterized membrane protein